MLTVYSKFIELDFLYRSIDRSDPIVINGVDGLGGVELDQRVAFAVRPTAP